MGKCYNHLTKEKRIRMETLLNAGFHQAEVARRLGVSRTTVCLERKRGLYVHTNSLG